MLTLKISWKYRLLDNFDPGLIEFDDAIRLSIAAIVAVLTYYFCALSQSVWIITFGVLITFMFRGHTVKQRYITFFSFAIIALLLIGLSTLLSHSALAYSLLLFVSVLLIFMLIHRGFDVLISGIFALVLGFLAAGHAGDWHNALQRVLMCSLGLICASTSTLLWPYRPRLAIRRLNKMLPLLVCHYLHWIFRDNFYGTQNSQRLLDLKRKILVNIQKTWDLLSTHPDQQQYDDLMKTSDVFVAIHLIAKQLQMTELNRLLSQQLLELIPISDCLEQVSTNWAMKIEYTAILDDCQQLTQLIMSFERKYDSNQSVQIFCYILQQAVDTLLGQSNAKTLFFS